jgi:hypothetical protein
MRARERNGALPNRMALRLGLLWLTLILALIIQCSHDLSFNFTQPVRCLRESPAIRVTQIEEHWPRKCGRPRRLTDLWAATACYLPTSQTSLTHGTDTYAEGTHCSLSVHTLCSCSVLTVGSSLLW